ncbi:hypothetical protein AB0K86_10935 [Streptomyces clavifer]|uniref:hypothetical protein n=1 Tax=Streptomyces TaxID=1883 RepID=UPI0007C87C4E|nr:MULTISPECIES: hypothetical protein [unclassified Streptomyces]
MADFRRPPEWQQSADRHTQLTDPVLTVRQLTRFEYVTRKPVTQVDHALVFVTARGEYDTFLPPHRPARADMATRRYTAVYEVDMGIHPVRAELALPSDNDAFEFGVAVDLSWQVREPDVFVRSGHRHVPELLLGELQQAARPVTRTYPVHRSAEAEQAVLRAVEAQGVLGATAGLLVTWTVRVRRDDDNIAHEKRKQAIEHQSAEQVLIARRGMDIDLEADLRSRQQDLLLAGRSLEHQRQQHELAMQQQALQHQHALLAGRQDLELQALQAQKINFYAYHLQHGGVHAWALHLSEHPEDSRLVMQSMRDDQLRLIQQQKELVSELLGGKHAEAFELDGPKELALRTVTEILAQRLPGVADTVPTPVPPAPLPPADAVPPEPALPPAPHAPADAAPPAPPGTAPGQPGTAPPSAESGPPLAGAAVHGTALFDGYVPPPTAHGPYPGRQPLHGPPLTAPPGPSVPPPYGFPPPQPPAAPATQAASPPPMPAMPFTAPSQGLVTPRSLVPPHDTAPSQEPVTGPQDEPSATDRKGRPS